MEVQGSQKLDNTATDGVVSGTVVGSSHPYSETSVPGSFVASVIFQHFQGGGIFVVVRSCAASPRAKRSRKSVAARTGSFQEDVVPMHHSMGSAVVRDVYHFQRSSFVQGQP